MKLQRFRHRRGACRGTWALIVAAGAGLVGISPRSASAQNWIGSASDTWSNPANWSSFPLSSTSTTLTFAASGSQSFIATNDLPGPFTLVGLNLDGTSTGSVTVATGSLSSLVFNGVAPQLHYGMPGSTNLNGRAQVGTPLIVAGDVGAGTLTINAAMSGAGLIINSNSPDSVFLNGANTFSGGVTLINGMLALGREDSLGTGTLTFFNGRLDYGSFVPPSGLAPNRPIIANSIQVTGTGLTIGGNWGFSHTGGIYNASGLTFTPTNFLDQTWTINSTNPLSGALTINGSSTPGVTSTLIINSAAMQNLSTINFNSGTSPLLISSTSTPALLNQTVNTGPTGAQLGVYSTSTVGQITQTGTIIGGTSLQITGNGVINLAGTNSFSGGLLLNSGIASVSTDANLGGPASNLTLAGGALVLDPAFGVTNRSIFVSAPGSTIYTQGNTTLVGTLSNAVSSGGFTKAGAGNLVLLGSSSFNNLITVASGTLIAQGLNGRILSTTSAGSITVEDGGAIELNNSGTFINRTGNATLSLEGGDFGFTGNATINSNINSTGTLNIGTNNISGGGEVIFRVTPGASANAAIRFNRMNRTFNNGSVVRFVAPNLGVNNIASLTAGATNISFNTSPSGQLVNGLFPFALVDDGAGSVDFATYDGANTFGVQRFAGYTTSLTGGSTTNVRLTGGGTVLAPAGTTTISSLKFEGGTLDISAGTLKLASGGLLVTQPSTITSGTLVFGIDALAAANAPTGNIFTNADLTIGSKILTFDGGGLVSGIVKSGPGILTLSAVNAYVGPTQVLSGTLRSGIANTIPSASELVIAPGATYDLNGFNSVIGSISQTSPLFTMGNQQVGTLNIGSNTLTAGGDNNSTAVNLNITGNGTFNKVGSGTFAVVGGQSFSGTVNIGNGVLLLRTHLTNGTGFANAARINIGTGNNSADCTLAFDFGLKDGFAVPIVANVPSGRVATLKFINSQDGAPGVVLNSPISIASLQGMTIDASSGVTIAGQITGTGPLLTASSDALLAGGTDGFSLNITGNNLYTGTTTLGAIVTLWGNSTAFGNTTSAIILGTSTGDDTPELSSSLGGLTLSRNITVNGSTNSVPNVAYIGSRATTGSTTYSGQINIAGSRSKLVLFSEAAPVLFTNVIQGGTASVQIGRSYGPGLETTRSTVILSSINTYTGGTSLAVGTLGLGTNSVNSGTTVVYGPVGTGTFTIGTADTPAGYGPTILAYGGARSINNRVIINSNFNMTGADALTFTGATDLNAGARVVNVDAGSRLNLSGTITGALGSALVKEGPGTLALGAINSYTGPTVAGAGTLLITATQRLNGPLNVAGGATVSMSSGGGKVLGATAVSIDTTNGGRIDLTDNGMIVNYTGASPFGSILALLNSAYNAGSWNGPGIMSSTVSGGFVHSRGIGFAEASDLGLSSFMGETVDADAIVMRYTLNGDANLDGTVDIKDLYLLSSHWDQPGSWVAGDFNYDGVVDATDLGALSSNWQQAIPSFASILIPEPMQTAMILLGALGFTAKRRTRRWAPGMQGTQERMQHVLNYLAV